MSDFQVNGILL